MLSSEQKTRLRVLSVVVAAIWVALGLIYQWPMWLWIGLAFVSLLAPSLTAYGVVEWHLRTRTRKVHDFADEEVVEEPKQTAEAPSPQLYEVRDVLLRSAYQDYRFAFACTVFWRLLPHAPGLPHPNPAALAADLIVAEAASLAASIPPDEDSRARYRMMNVLGSARVDQTGRVEVWADDIALSLSEKDAERLMRLAEVRKDEEVWEHERSYERNVRAYLGEDVLTTPGSAVVWWLAGPRTDEKRRVDEVVEKISSLQKLTAAAAMTELPTSTAGPFDFGTSLSAKLSLLDECSPPPAGLSQLPFVLSERPAVSDGEHPDESRLGLDDYAVGLVEELPEGPERAMFARRLADLLEVQGHSEAAEQVRRRFDAPPVMDVEQGADQWNEEKFPFSSAATGFPDEGGVEQSSVSREAMDSQEPDDIEPREVDRREEANDLAQEADESPKASPPAGQLPPRDENRTDGERPL
ncbi:hypothetical protein SAMN05216215_1004155 [Saccharopolyspora shandongensis]|uniref:Uncharacterized protein n=1 Tax=Saccharopolyspora shandongensis TaxID=418495 RepID=A0A1H2V1Q3_9PSEU|nr:hypothetical protein [Saccharopolyspora shandongensis]SDW61834.1 hypothetical protein SAMN05216215_1004155 [Saccharopolyspora shandongensis]